MKRLVDRAPAGAAALCICLAPSPAGASFLIDFEHDDNGIALGNGQIIDAEFSTDFTITSPDTSISHLGPAIFDSTPGGPNAAGGDPDLLVNLGNLLILQNTAYTGNDGAFFFEPNDEADFHPLGSGTVVFGFRTPVELHAIDLVDIDAGLFVTVQLFDGDGGVRTYQVPRDWTYDINLNPAANGYDTLDLTTLAPQVGEGGGVAQASETIGFDPADVGRMEITIGGSAGIDNIVYVPLPSTLAALLAGLAGTRCRRRRMGSELE